MPTGIYTHKPLSDKTREKISISMKGKKNSIGYRHSINSIKKISKSSKERIPYKRTDEIRNKMSLAQIGNKSWRWRGGISSKNTLIRKGIEIRLWRESSFARDGFTCQRCGRVGGELNCHHIYNFADYPELRTSIENGITLCKKCHTGFHEKYGKKNNVKEQLDEFLE